MKDNCIDMIEFLKRKRQVSEALCGSVLVENCCWKGMDLAALAALAACHRLSSLKMAVSRALDTGVKPEEIRETIQLCEAFIGKERTRDCLLELEFALAERGRPAKKKRQPNTSNLDLPTLRLLSLVIAAACGEGELVLKLLVHDNLRCGNSRGLQMAVICHVAPHIESAKVSQTVICIEQG